MPALVGLGNPLFDENLTNFLFPLRVTVGHGQLAVQGLAIAVLIRHDFFHQLTFFQAQAADSEDFHKPLVIEANHALIQPFFQVLFVTLFHALLDFVNGRGRNINIGLGLGHRNYPVNGIDPLPQGPLRVVAFWRGFSAGRIAVFISDNFFHQLAGSGFRFGGRKIDIDGDTSGKKHGGCRQRQPAHATVPRIMCGGCGLDGCGCGHGFSPVEAFERIITRLANGS